MRQVLPVEMDCASEERFWKSVDIKTESECWNWTASLREGYGAFRLRGKLFSAHRVAYVIKNGNPDPQLVIAHKCDNRKCCNPSHLEAITFAQNNRDQWRINPQILRGESKSNAVLSNDLVKQVIALRGEGFGVKLIAAKLDISFHCIRDVIRGRSWKHITGGPVIRFQRADQ